MKVVAKELGKGPIGFGDNWVKSKHIPTAIQVDSKPKDHEASSSKSLFKYLQPRWCLSGLSHTKKQRLQWLRKQELVEQQVEKLRDATFNEIQPIQPMKQI